MAAGTQGRVNPLGYTPTINNPAVGTPGYAGGVKPPPNSTGTNPNPFAPPSNAIVSGAPNSAASGNFGEYTTGNQGNIPGVVTPTNANQTLANNIYNNASTQFQNYNQNNSLNQSLGAQSAAAGRQQLASNINQTRQGYNASGLLNSGLEQNAEAGQTSAAQQQQAQNQASINQGLYSNQNQLGSNAFSIAGANAQPGANTQQTALNQLATTIASQQTNQALQASLYGQAAGGVGSVAGVGLGSALNSTPSYSGSSNTWNTEYGNLGPSTNSYGYQPGSAAPVQPGAVTPTQYNTNGYYAQPGY